MYLVCTVTINTDKYRLVGIPPSGHDKDSVSTWNATIVGKEW